MGNRRHWNLAIFMIWGISLGCQAMKDKQLYPTDPLLVNRQPAKENRSATPPSQVAMAEPVAPAFPQTNFASRQPTSPAPANEFAVDRHGIRAYTASRSPRHSVPVLPAVRSLPPVKETVQAGLEKTYGHAEDYRWLQGILDKHYQGHFNLRYCDCTCDDRWGGKVHLEPTHDLIEFRDGDIVRVEGMMLQQLQLSQQCGSHYPRYRILKIELIRRPGGQ